MNNVLSTSILLVISLSQRLMLLNTTTCLSKSLPNISLPIPAPPLAVVVAGDVDAHPSNPLPTVLCVKSAIELVMLLPNVKIVLTTHISMRLQIPPLSPHTPTWQHHPFLNQTTLSHVTHSTSPNTFHISPTLFTSLYCQTCPTQQPAFFKFCTHISFRFTSYIHISTPHSNTSPSHPLPYLSMQHVTHNSPHKSTLQHHFFLTQTTLNQVTHSSSHTSTSY